MKYYLTLITNLLDPTTQRRIVEGPFGFETEKELLGWKSRFERRLERENRELILPPGCNGISVEYSRRYRPDAEPPSTVRAVIGRLRNFWDTYVLEAASA